LDAAVTRVVATERERGKVHGPEAVVDFFERHILAAKAPLQNHTAAERASVRWRSVESPGNALKHRGSRIEITRRQAGVRDDAREYRRELP
jgi:hypothetical protein